MRPEEPVSRIMTEAVVAIDVDRPVSEAVDCFLQYPIHHLPVVQSGRIVGILSSADLMKLDCFVPKDAADRTRFIDDRVTIRQLMHAPVISLQAHASIGDAARYMMDAGVHAVPVVDANEHVVGIVTTSDVIQSLLRGPPRKGDDSLLKALQYGTADGSGRWTLYRHKPSPQETDIALRTAELLHVEERDPRHLGKTLLYLDQRVSYLEKVLELADRFLLSGQDVQVHALLLKAIHAAKRAEEHATGQARVPFPLE